MRMRRGPGLDLELRSAQGTSDEDAGNLELRQKTRQDGVCGES
jgi:hypothetical protein